MSKPLAKLEKLLSYNFQDLRLLERAVTHRSWAYEKLAGGEEVKIRNLHNETLEFVGDSVLGLAVAELLYKNNPTLSEGDLTLMKHYLVSMETLAVAAKEIGLGKFMLVGKGEEKTGGRRKQALLADTLEAVIAAIFFDSGYVNARNFVSRILREEFQKATPISSIDYKTLLQETLQAERRTAPVYKLVETEGPPHKRTFLVEAVWDSGKTKGKGNSIKSAEMEAANLALKKLQTESNKITNLNVLKTL
ncbi:MAG: ribonuclease III [Acidobacteriota bacterium]|jgi:ribonuclease-3|nr:ribonuclease III [Acidobacteriota bacterium]